MTKLSAGYCNANIINIVYSLLLNDAIQKVRYLTLNMYLLRNVLRKYWKRNANITITLTYYSLWLDHHLGLYGRIMRFHE